MTGRGGEADAGAAARAARLQARALALGIELTSQGAGFLVRYLDAMLAENEHVNLTAIRDLEQALVLHALDSLAMAKVIDGTPRAVFDLGSGNGFPGVAAAVLWPRARIVLCDRTHKKAAAIGRALDAVRRHRAPAAGALAESGPDLAAIEVEPEDVEQARARRPGWIGAFDLVTVRAVGSSEQVATLARPLLQTGGQVALWLEATATCGELRGYRLAREATYELPDPARRTRRLAIYRRISS